MTEDERYEEAKRIREAGEAIVGIFHEYEKATGFAISDEKYDQVRLLVREAGEKYLERR